MNIDFSMARTKHMTWKSRLRNYLKGSDADGLDKIQATSPRHCDLGKWLYMDGMSKYGNNADMKQLEKIHAEMHATVGKVINAKDAGNMNAAQAELAKVSDLSGKVVELLTKIEKAVS